MENQTSNPIAIDNPNQVLTFDLPWQEVNEHIQKLIALFPKEYKLIKDDEKEGKLMIFYTPPAPDTIGKDQLLYITKQSSTFSSSEVKFEISNEDNKIHSFSEFERDKKTLDISIKVLQKSIAGTLSQTVSNMNSKAKQAQEVQGVIGVVRILLAIGLIALGIWAFTKS